MPIDFSDTSTLALQEAAKLATSTTEVFLLHVIDPGFFGRGAAVAPDFADDAVVRDCALHLREILDTLLERLVGSRIVVRQGPPDREILGCIDELQPDLVVMTVANALNDDTAESDRQQTARSVLRQASCPVMLLQAS